MGTEPPLTLEVDPGLHPFGISLPAEDELDQTLPRERKCYSFAPTIGSRGIGIHTFHGEPTERTCTFKALIEDFLGNDGHTGNSRSQRSVEISRTYPPAALQQIVSREGPTTRRQAKAAAALQTHHEGPMINIPKIGTRIARRIVLKHPLGVHRPVLHVPVNSRPGPQGARCPL